MKSESQIDSKIKELETYLENTKKYGLNKLEQKELDEDYIKFKNQIRILKWVLS